VKKGRNDMKKVTVLLLAGLLALSGCGESRPADETVPEETAQSAKEEEKETEQAVTPEEETVDDPTWEALESLGMVETENGLFYVSITLPAEMAGTEVTQESIDANAGETYTSGKLNEDGSVTYKMTKAQHKAMLEQLSKTIDDALKEMSESGEYAISEVTHNDDFTSFDVKLTGDDLGFAEGFMTIAFYMYGGMYSIFTGKKKDIMVNFYNASGELINSASSANAGE